VNGILLGEAEQMAVIDRLLDTRGGVLNDRLAA
jgi:hypothetical protein